MKIVLINKYFSEKMGYSDFFLCKALAALGHEVHLVTSQYQLQEEFYNGNYEDFLGPREQACGTKQFENFTLHRLPAVFTFGYFRTPKLLRFIKKLSPDVVFSLETIKWDTFFLALGKPFLKYKLFTDDHVHLSVFPPAHQKLSLWKTLRFFIYKKTIAKFLIFSINKCYAIAPDTKKIMVDYFGISKDKIEISPLVSDSDMFRPALSSQEIKSRNEIREKFSVQEDEILCIYTGRFTNGKDPACLAQAIDKLQNMGMPYKAIFFGAGDEQYETIKNSKACIIHPFVLARDLPNFYQAADIGVWPRQESTSQLDAMATGLPIIISNKVEVEDRWVGNGLQYIEGDIDSMKDALLKLQDKNIRLKKGKVGREKIEKKMSWNYIAKLRLADFENY